MSKPKPKLHHVQIVRGVAGLAVYLNDYRIAGEKPWGGGQTIAEWFTTEEDLRAGLASEPCAATVEKRTRHEQRQRPHTATRRP